VNVFFGVTGHLPYKVLRRLASGTRPTALGSCYTALGLSEPRNAPDDLRLHGHRTFTVREAAPYVRGSDDYVRKLIRAGVLAAVKLSPRKTLIHERDLFQFLHGR
jgi:excisionase family DNA binding protein